MYYITLLYNFDHFNCDYQYRGLYMSINDLFLDRICYIKKLLLHVFWELVVIFLKNINYMAVRNGDICSMA